MYNYERNIWYVLIDTDAEYLMSDTCNQNYFLTVNSCFMYLYSTFS